jgi:uncharacterized protein
MDLEGLDLLSEQECRWLLREARVGRVAVSLGQVPAVFPVNYMVAGDDILFFTAEGTKLRAATTKATVTFEVDDIDPFAETSRSVMVVGQAHERTEAAVIDGAKRAGLHPWAAGDRFHLIAVAMDFVSGRRIGEGIEARHPSRHRDQQMVGPHSPVGGLAQRPVRVGADWTLQAAADAMWEANVSAVLWLRPGHRHRAGPVTGAQLRSRTEGPRRRHMRNRPHRCRRRHSRGRSRWAHVPPRDPPCSVAQLARRNHRRRFAA